MDFNTIVNYIDIIDDILSVDSIIKNVYLEPIAFVDSTPHVDYSGITSYLIADESTITGKYTLNTSFLDYDGYTIKTYGIDENFDMVDYNGESCSEFFYTATDGSVVPLQLELSTSYSGPSNYPQYVLTDSQHKYHFFTSEKGRDRSVHGYYDSGNDAFYEDVDHLYMIVPETDGYYYDITTYPIEPTYRLYQYNGTNYIGQVYGQDRFEKLPVKFLTVSHDISHHGYYYSLTNEFYINDAPNPNEKLTKINGDYYTDDKTRQVYLCDGTNFTLQTNPEICIKAYMLEDDDHNPLDIKFPVRPGNFVIKIDNDRHIVYDNKNGELVSESGIFYEGYVNYETGDMYVTFTTKITNAIFSYTRNCINLVKFDGLNVNKFYVADECLNKA
jgi:hypothetical protein